MRILVLLSLLLPLLLRASPLPRSASERAYAHLVDHVTRYTNQLPAAPFFARHVYPRIATTEHQLLSTTELIELVASRLHHTAESASRSATQLRGRIGGQQRARQQHGHERQQQHHHLIDRLAAAFDRWGTGGNPGKMSGAGDEPASSIWPTFVPAGTMHNKRPGLQWNPIYDDCEMDGAKWMNRCALRESGGKEGGREGNRGYKRDILDGIVSHAAGLGGIHGACATKLSEYSSM